MNRRMCPVWLVLLLSLVPVLFSPGMVSANSAPPRWHGNKAGLPLPGASAQVHVLQERLTFDVSAERYGFPKARVTARYEMENRGPLLRSFPVIFVIQDVGGTDRNLTVTWNGKPVPATSLGAVGAGPEPQSEVAAAWEAMNQIVDPVTGAPEAMGEYFGSTSLQLLQFDLDLAADQRGTLEVSFDQAAATDRTGYVHTTYHYQYLIRPAKGWASFGPLQISIRVPETAYFGSTLPMTYEDGEYRATFDGLPPTDLAFSLMSKRGVIGNMVTSGPYFWMAFLLLIVVAVALGMGLGWLASLPRSRGWAVALAVGGGIMLGGCLDLLAAFGVMALFPALENQGYAVAFVGIAQALAAALVTVVVTIVSGLRRHSRRHGL